MSDTTLSRAFPTDRPHAAASSTPQRTTHGSCAWSLPSRFQSMRQPQDGAITSVVQGNVGLLRSIEARTRMSVDAEDARLNGSLRSLARRVKGLNVMSRPAEPAAAQPERYYAEPTGRKLPEAGRKSTHLVTARPQVA